MSRDDDLVGGPVKAAVTFVVRRITEEDTQGGARSEFVGSGGGEVGVASTPEDMEVLIGGRRPVKHHVRGGETKCLGRRDIEECGGGEGLNPISWWNASLKR
jgi:hypothetical protein